MTWLSSHWPLLVVCAGMVLAAVIDGWKFKVPNWLTYSLIVSGWLLGLLHSVGLLQTAGQGGIGASLAGTGLGFVLLFPMYAIGGMGAGDVKMQMGFGSWVGAYFGIASGSTVILHAFCTAAVIGGLLALVMIVVRRQYRRNLEHTRAIVSDLATARGLGAVAEKADQRRPRWHRLPYGIPLCIGFIGYLLWIGS